MTCQTCGNPHQQNFCPNCGEKRFDPHSLSLKHVVEESLESFTHADHNFVRTVQTVLFRPGELPIQYVAGRRVHFMKPLGFFLLVNLIFFLLASTNTFNQPLNSFLNFSPYSDFGTKEAVQRVLDSKHETLAEFTPLFNAAMTSSSKGFLVLLIPLYALIFSLIFIAGRRTFIEHLIFATYFVSFLLLFMLAETYLITLPFIWIFGQQAWTDYGDTLVSILIILVLTVYLSRAFRRFYQTPVRWSLPAALLSSAVMAALLVAYRMVLFYKIIYTGH